MKDVLIIQNSKAEGSGLLGKLLQDDGYRLRTVFAKKEKLPQEEYSLVVILGAPESANDDLEYLKNEMKLIKRYAQKEKPVLGICLGSQLIAKTFGAKVYAGPRKEIGFYNDVAVDDSELFSGLQNPLTVFHWHGDTFTLPDNATRLAHSIHYENQAFVIGSAVGIQFHLEVDEPMIKLWLDKTQEKLVPYINFDNIRNEIPNTLPTVNKNMEIFYKNLKSKFHL